MPNLQDIGSSIGSTLGGVPGGVAGSLAGAALQGLGNLFGGGGGTGPGRAGEDGVVHRPAHLNTSYSPFSPADRFNTQEIDAFKRVAAANSVYHEDVVGAFWWDKDRPGANSPSFQSVYQWWTNNNGPQHAAWALGEWFKQHPELQAAARGAAQAHQQQGAGGSSSTAPTSAYQPQLPPAPSSQAFAVGGVNIGGLLGDILTGGVRGAQTGVTDVILNTPQGQQAQDQGAIEFFKRRWYIPLALVALIGGLFVKAFSGRK
jgi:hypothetical protein